MKIYIMGPTGSGKTTLAEHLASVYKIPTYELDCLVYDDEHDHVKRSDEEIQKLFNNILKKKDWIIEDIGRTKFIKGLDKSDRIYYLKLSKNTVYFRVVKRWIRQKLGLERYNYPPTFSQFKDMLKVAKGYFGKEKEKLDRLDKYKEKVVYLSKKELNKILKDYNMSIDL